ncbi:hypothetical protein IAT40_002860 [Kwoniella sp. CBS 6097]
MPPPSTVPSGARKRKGGPQPIAPAPPKYLPGHLQVDNETRSSPSASVSSLDHDNDNDEYLPRQAPKSAVSKKRASTTQNQGATGGKMSKMSREALRKANHSLIERRRREKINAALGELREMVPGLGEGGTKGGEFKLEVLERTVAHMKDLKRHIRNLETALSAHGIQFEPQGDGNEDDDEEGEEEDEDEGEEEKPTRMGVASGHLPDPYNHGDGIACPGPSTSSSSYRRTQSQQAHANPAYNQQHLAKGQSYHRQHAHSPYPSPSPDAHHHPLSPDPNETEPEPNLPPPLTKAQPRRIKQEFPRSNSGSPGLSVTSLLSSAQNHSRRSSPNQSLSRPPPPPQANNPIFLPFPAPSPTSPFLTTHGGGGVVGGLPDPSPFLAPMSGMSLFGGVIPLEAAPVDAMSSRHGNGNGNGSRQQNSPPQLSLPPSRESKSIRGHSREGSGRGHKDMPPEEAANLLLAFSSPDTLGPQVNSGSLTTRGRRSTLDSEDFEFSLDSGAVGLRHEDMVGKSARDILSMTEFQR